MFTIYLKWYFIGLLKKWNTQKKAYDLQFLFYFYSRLASSTSFSNQAERYGSKGYLDKNETINVKHHLPWPWNQLNLTFKKCYLKFLSKRKKLPFLLVSNILCFLEMNRSPYSYVLNLEKIRFRSCLVFTISVQLFLTGSVFSICLDKLSPIKWIILGHGESLAVLPHYVNQMLNRINSFWEAVKHVKMCSLWVNR